MICWLHIFVTQMTYYKLHKMEIEMIDAQALTEAGAAAQQTMQSYDDARALQGVANADWVQTHFTHRGDVQSRQALHEAIIRNAFANATPAAQGEKPEAIVICGPFAAGKDHLLEEMRSGKSYTSNTMNALAQKVRGLASRAVHTDMDAVRKQIPEYQAAVAAKNPDASAIVRAEVHGLSVAITQTAKTRGYPLVQVESYADPSAVDHIRKLSETHRVTLIGIAATPQEIHQHNTSRAAVTGRHIPTAQIDDSIRKFAAVFPKLKDVAAEVLLVDNAPGREPSIMYHAKDGQVALESFSPDSFTTFIKLANYGVTPSHAAEQPVAAQTR